MTPEKNYNLIKRNIYYLIKKYESMPLDPIQKHLNTILFHIINKVLMGSTLTIDNLKKEFKDNEN